MLDYQTTIRILSSDLDATLAIPWQIKALLCLYFVTVYAPYFDKHTKWLSQGRSEVDNYPGPCGLIGEKISVLWPIFGAFWDILGLFSKMHRLA